MARNPFWTYSLRIYRQPGVSSACIALQDHAEADVNLLLFCLWAGQQRIALSPAVIAGALAVSKEWRGAMMPLRQARRALKPMGVDRLRGALLRLEIQAERLQQDRLYALICTTKRGKGEAVMVAADNLAAYFRGAGIVLTRRDWPALRAVVRRAFA